MRQSCFLTAISFALFTAGCGGSKEMPAVSSTSATENLPANALLQKFVEPSTASTVKGKVIFEGQPPAAKEISVKGNPECSGLHPGGTITSEELVVNTGALQNVFVYVKEGLEGYSFPQPEQAVTIENSKCMYVPHVSGARVGQNIIFLNQDSTLHNIHSYPKASKAFNLGLPMVGMKQTRKFDAPEIMVPLKCDVHPWMLGYVGVVSHPYFGVSDAKGEFELKNLPPGEYTIQAWHEKLGVQTQKIIVGAQEIKEIEIRFAV